MHSKKCIRALRPEKNCAVKAAIRKVLGFCASDKKQQTCLSESRRLRCDQKYLSNLMVQMSRTKSTRWFRCCEDVIWRWGWPGKAIFEQTVGAVFQFFGYRHWYSDEVSWSRQVCWGQFYGHNMSYYDVNVTKSKHEEENGHGGHMPSCIRKLNRNQ